MNLGQLSLAIYLLATAIDLLGWHTVSPKVLGVLALITAILFFMRGLALHDTNIKR